MDVQLVWKFYLMKIFQLILRYFQNVEIDAEMEEKFKEILNETEKWLDIEIGSCNKEMYISDTKSAQLENIQLQVL